MSRLKSPSIHSSILDPSLSPLPLTLSPSSDPVRLQEELLEDEIRTLTVSLGPEYAAAFITARKGPA